MYFSVPTFESKDGLLSPVQLVLSPLNRNFAGSALSLRSSYSTHSIMSEASTIFGPEKEQVLTERMRIIVDSFQNRARRVKQRLEQPPTPTDDGSEDLGDPVGPKLFLEDFVDAKDSKYSMVMGSGEKWRDLRRRIEFIDPRGHINIGKQQHYFVIILFSFYTFDWTNGSSLSPIFMNILSPTTALAET